MTREFEQQIKSMPSFQKQVFIHGERLFIIENGQYKIAVIQLAWEVHQQQQKTIDEANAKAQMCRDEKNHAINRWSAICKERDEQQKRIAEQQNQIDLISEKIHAFWDYQPQTPTQREYANFIADIEVDLKALRGGQ